MSALWHIWQAVSNRKSGQGRINNLSGKKDEAPWLLVRIAVRKTKGSLKGIIGRVGVELAHRHG